nr:hypothetical protein [Tanacetum cinerariifolium]
MVDRRVVKEGSTVVEVGAFVVLGEGLAPTHQVVAF